MADLHWVQKGLPTCTLQRHNIHLSRSRRPHRCVIVSAAAPAQSQTLDAQVAVVLGTQWGDEGKGKLVDILAQQYDIVARAQVSTYTWLSGYSGADGNVVTRLPSVATDMDAEAHSAASSA